MRPALIAAITALCIASATATNAVQEAMTLKAWRNAPERNAYLQGVRDGLLAYNAALALRHAEPEPEFCLPSGYDLSVEKAEELMLPGEPEDPVPLLMLFALRAERPCPPKFFDPAPWR